MHRLAVGLQCASVAPSIVKCVFPLTDHRLLHASQVLAVVSQASVAFVFFFALVVAVICFSPVHSAGARCSVAVAWYAPRA